MAGSATNAHLWADADVYVNFNLGATIPVDISTPFDISWDLIGLLDGDTGFTESRAEDVVDHFAWGGILMRTSRRHFKLSRKFTAYEWNDTTRRLRWPGSISGEIVVPRPENILIAFEVTDSETGIKHRVISADHAQCTIDADVVEDEGNMSALPFVAIIYPDTSVSPALLFIEQHSGPGS